MAAFKIREGIGERMELLDVTDVYVATARINLENESVKGYTDDCVITEETCEDEDDDEMESMEYATGGLKEDRQEYKYSCFKCLKSYKRKGHLVEHQKIFCGKDKQQCCPYCSFRTYKKSNLKKHVSRMHCNDTDAWVDRSNETPSEIKRNETKFYTTIMF